MRRHILDNLLVVNDNLLDCDGLLGYSNVLGNNNLLGIGVTSQTRATVLNIPTQLD